MIAVYRVGSLAAFGYPCGITSILAREQMASTHDGTAIVLWGPSLKEPIFMISGESS